MVTDTGPFVFLDIGANPDSTGENLYQYAHMGAIFAERVLGEILGGAVVDRRGRCRRARARSRRRPS
jgi:hypothetical protein